ncbi:unnamed protein product [Coregonus sp. 'balchen']|nr:unnamed protein product [Coregonus sp. 'balchen']
MTTLPSGFSILEENDNVVALRHLLRDAVVIIPKRRAVHPCVPDMKVGDMMLDYEFVMYGKGELSPVYALLSNLAESCRVNCFPMVKLITLTRPRGSSEKGPLVHKLESVAVVVESSSLYRTDVLKKEDPEWPSPDLIDGRDRIKCKNKISVLDDMFMRGGERDPLDGYEVNEWHCAAPPASFSLGVKTCVGKLQSESFNMLGRVVIDSRTARIQNPVAWRGFDALCTRALTCPTERVWTRGICKVVNKGICMFKHNARVPIANLIVIVDAGQWYASPSYDDKTYNDYTNRTLKLTLTLNHGYVRMGDSPEDIACDGIFFMKRVILLLCELKSVDIATALLSTASFTTEDICSEQFSSGFVLNSITSASSKIRDVQENDCASRGQSADLILVDEVGFVNSKVLLAVLPNIVFRGRKQVHITSHVNNTPWLNKVADILREDGEPAYHVVSQSFKCRYHERESGPTCFCLGVYCPQHISVDNHLKELMNMVTPKGFESEVTGSSSTSSMDTKNENTTPFQPSVINKFLSNNSVTLEYITRASVVRAYLCLDPTFGGGSRSCAGVCCAVELAGGNLVMALEELENRDLDQVTRVYAALLSAHVRLLKCLLPRVMWKEVPMVMIFEQNTYFNALIDVLFYSKFSHINNKYMLGKHVGANTKLAMVLSTVSAIDRQTLHYCDTIMSLGWAVLSEATKKT